MSEASILPPFRVSRPAIQAIEDLGGAVRIDVEDGGCCGSTYVCALVDPDSDVVADDARYGCPGAWLFVSSTAGSILDGAVLDYGATLKPPRVRIPRNPNVDNVCACRRSFGDAWPGPGQPTCRSYLPMPWDAEYEPPPAWRRQTGWTGRPQPSSQSPRREEPDATDP